MSNITLSVPENIHREMKEFSEVKWSEVARKAIIKKIEALRMAEQIAKKSKLTGKDIEQFNRKIKALAAQRFLNENSS